VENTLEELETGCNSVDHVQGGAPTATLDPKEGALGGAQLRNHDRVMSRPPATSGHEGPPPQEGTPQQPSLADFALAVLTAAKSAECRVAFLDPVPASKVLHPEEEGEQAEDDANHRKDNAGPG